VNGKKSQPNEVEEIERLKLDNGDKERLKKEKSNLQISNFQNRLIIALLDAIVLF
jgi:hypothetical protein